MIVHGFYSFIIFLVSLFSVYFSYKLILKSNGNANLPTIGMFFMFNYLIFIYIGSVLMNIYIPETNFMPGKTELLGIDFDRLIRLPSLNQDIYLLNHREYLLNTWVLSTAVLFLLPSGMLLFNKVFSKKPVNVKKLKYNNIKEEKLFKIVIYFFVIAIIVFFLYTLKIEKIPFIALLEGYSKEEIMFFRSESGNSFNGKYHWYNLFMRIIPIILLLVSITALYLKKNKKWLIITIFIFIYSLFIAIMSTSKAPVIFLCLQIFILYLMLKKNVNIKILFGVFLVLFITILILYYYFHKLEFAPLNILFSVFHRLFLGQIVPFYWWQVYQENFGFINGLSFPNPKQIFPFDHINISVEIMKMVHPELASKKITGSMPTVFYADWWINFGLLSAFLSMILLGFIMQAFEQIIINKMVDKFSILLFSLYIYGILFFSKYVMTSYIGILIDVKIIIPAILVFILDKYVNKEEKV